MQEFRASYGQLRAQWLGTAAGAVAQATTAQVAGYDRWVAKANNASFAAQAAYDELVPAFEALFERQGRDWPRFYDAVRQLAQQPQPQRREALRALLPAQPPQKSS
jgi:predicted aminopeptidase